MSLACLRSTPRSDMLVSPKMSRSSPCREGFACRTPESPKFAVWSLVQSLAQGKTVTSTRSDPDHLSGLWFLHVSPEPVAGTQTGLYFRCSLASTKQRKVITPLYLLALLLLKQPRMRLPWPAACLQTSVHVGLFLRRRTQIHFLPGMTELATDRRVTHHGANACSGRSRINARRR